MKPKDLIALGGMEVIMELENYQTTWETETKCIVVKLPRAKYEKWIYADIDIFRLESKITCESLLEESRRNRLYLFLQGADRLALLLVEWFEKFNKNGQLCINESRQNIADETGLCLKSVSRGVKKFAGDGLIIKKGNQILITQEQYEGLRQIVNDNMYSF